MTLSDTMRQVAADCATDAANIDGQPFTGRNVAEAFGTTLAMLAAVAKVAAILAEKVEATE